MPVSETQADLANDNTKMGLTGKSGARAEKAFITDPAYEPQYALGDVFNPAWNSDTAVREVQTATVTGGPTGGTFTLTYDGQTTAPIAYNADAAAVEAALVALSNISPGDVTVTGNAGGPYTVTFGGSKYGVNVSQITASGAGLTGGTTPSVTTATTTQGAP